MIIYALEKKSNGCVWDVQDSIYSGWLLMREARIMSATDGNPGNSCAACVDSCVKPPVKMCPNHFIFNFVSFEVQSQNHIKGDSTFFPSLAHTVV